MVKEKHDEKRDRSYLSAGFALKDRVSKDHGTIYNSVDHRATLFGADEDKSERPQLTD